MHMQSSRVIAHVPHTHRCSGQRTAAVAAAQRYASAGRGVSAYCRATPSTMRRARTKAPLTASRANARRRLTADPRLIVARTCTARHPQEMRIAQQSGIMLETLRLAARGNRPALERRNTADTHEAELTPEAPRQYWHSL